MCELDDDDDDVIEMLKRPVSMETMKRASHEPDQWFRFPGRRRSWREKLWGGGGGNSGLKWVRGASTVVESDGRGEEGGQPLFPRVQMSHEVVSDLKLTAESHCRESL